MAKVKALNYTQRIVQGDSFDKSYTATEIDTQTNTETPKDLSGKTVRGSIRQTDDAATSVDFTTSTFDSGSGTVDTFRLQLTNAQTSAMQPGTWKYDIEIMDDLNNNIVETVLKGNFVIRAEITK